MQPIYTRRGDRGKTSAGNKKQLCKNHTFFHLIGTLDELCSILGLVRCFTKDSLVNTAVAIVQNDIMDISAELNQLFSDEPLSSGYKISAHYTHKLERFCDDLHKNLPSLNHFILPGGADISSAHLHVARSITRRAERYLCKWISENNRVNPEIPPYINRLSDLLFLLARYCEKERKDNLWKPWENRSLRHK